jgi:guanosine-3',5'-bis(diphosphate) 3'-pyrophosphohydrolase
MDRVVPLRTSAREWRSGRNPENPMGRSHSPGWLTFAITAKARAAIRRYIRQKQRDEEPSRSAKSSMRKLSSRFSPGLASDSVTKPLKAALKRLKLDDQAPR